MRECTGSILLVDDVLENLELLVRRLSPLGYSVTTVTSGLAALDAIDRAEFDVVLLDLQMPGMDGFETLRLIREKADNLQLPVIVLTGHTGTDTIVSALAAGANDFIPKPFDFRILAARLRNQILLKMAEGRFQALVDSLEGQLLQGTETRAHLNRQLEQEVRERQHANRVLREIWKTRRLSEQVAGIGYWRLDVETKSMELSEVIHNLMAEGKETDVVAFEDFLTLFGPATAAEVRTQFDRCIEDGDDMRFEVPIRPLKGEERDVAIYGRAEQDRSGKNTSLYGVLQDISSRRRAEKAMQHEEEKFRLAFETAPQGMLLLDSEVKIIKVNERFAAMLGAGAADLIGSEFLGIFDKASRAGVTDNINKLLNEVQASVGMVTMVTDRNGTVHDIELSLGMVEAPGSTAALLIAQCNDVTERLRAERALAESIERYMMLYNKTPTMMLTTDTAGRISTSSEYLRARLGYTPEALAGQSIRDFLSSQNSNMVVDLLKEAGQDFIPNIEINIADIHNNSIPVLASAQRTIMFDQEKWLICLTDLTERKQIEEQLFQSQKMEAVGQLTGGVAHDFNNILQVIIGNLQLLDRRLTNNEDARGRIAKVIGAATRGSELTRRLLAFSRRQVLETRRTDINMLLAEVSDLLSRSLRENVDLEMHIAPDLAAVIVDTAQLENALVNLAVNAMDAMPEGGKLTIEARNTVLDKAYAARHAEVQAGPYVQIAVSDTGTGIPEDLRDRVFEPFFTTKEKGKGTGLGLSMVYGFIKQMGGHIKLYSETGVGTCFKLYLRVDSDLPDQAAQPTQEIGTDAAGRGERVLLIEDEDDVRDVLATSLADNGYAVTSTGSAEEARTAYADDPEFDLVLSDVVISGQTRGPDLVTEFRARHNDLKVIYLSGYADQAFGRERPLGRYERFLTKPVSTDSLLQEVRSLLDLQISS